MIDPEVLRAVREEVRRQLNIILCGVVGNDTADYRQGILDLFPGMPEIPDKLVAHPYGFASRAPKGILSVTGRQGEHVGARLILAHLDKDRPAINRGETILYNEFGQACYLEKGKLHLGKKTAENPVVLGNELKAMLQELLTLLATHTHITGAPGSQTAPPFQEVTETKFTQIKADNVDNDKILSDYIFVDKTPG